MGILRNRIIHLLIIISTIILIDLISFKIALAAGNTQIIIGENIKPGMALKDTIKLLGPPETINAIDNGMVVMPYNSLGLSIEVMNGGTLIERIHVQPSFKGRFASGIEMGADYKKILSVYNQPDMMTKEIIEYSDLAMKFQIREGILVGAELYSEKSTSGLPAASTVTVKNEVVPEATQEEMREALREEVRQEIIAEYNEEFDAFDLFGFKVRQNSRKVIIAEIRPGSVAERGGLKVGEPVRRVFYDGAGKLNIYSVKGLEKFLRRAIQNNKKTVNVLQDKNYYYKVEVPNRK